MHAYGTLITVHGPRTVASSLLSILLALLSLLLALLSILLLLLLLLALLSIFLLLALLSLLLALLSLLFLLSLPLLGSLGLRILFLGLLPLNLNKLLPPLVTLQGYLVYTIRNKYI